MSEDHWRTAVGGVDGQMLKRRMNPGQLILRLILSSHRLHFFILLFLPRTSQAVWCDGGGSLPVFHGDELEWQLVDVGGWWTGGRVDRWTGEWRRGTTVLHVCCSNFAF